jgi:hypothetical protein
VVALAARDDVNGRGDQALYGGGDVCVELRILTQDSRKQGRA